jgi:hypothetical protein
MRPSLFESTPDAQAVAPTIIFGTSILKADIDYAKRRPASKGRLRKLGLRPRTAAASPNQKFNLLHQIA